MSNADPNGRPPVERPAAARRSWLEASWRHRRLWLRLAGLGLVVVVVLQNAEPTTLDFLFWSLPDVPKLVFFLGGMLFGVAVWEVWRRSRRGPGSG